MILKSKTICTTMLFAANFLLLSKNVKISQAEAYSSAKSSAFISKNRKVYISTNFTATYGAFL